MLFGVFKRKGGIGGCGAFYSKFWPTEVGLSTVINSTYSVPKLKGIIEAAIDTKGSGALVSTPVRGLNRSVSSGTYTCQAPSDRVRSSRCASRTPDRP